MTSGSQALNPSSLSFFPTNSGLEGAPEPVFVSAVSNTTLKPLMKRDSTRRSFSNTFMGDHRSSTSSPAGSIRASDSGDAVARPISETSSSGSSAHAYAEEEKRLLTSNQITLQPFAEEELLIARGSGALDGEETPGPRAIQQWMKAHPGESESIDFASTFSSAFNDRFHATHPPSASKALNNSNTANTFGVPFKSTSPVSSIGSASVNTSSIDYSTIHFDAQLKSSPIIKDLMDRLSRCEYSNREIQRDLAEIHTKVSILVERSTGHMNAEPEFRNPFATSSSTSRSLTPSGGLGPSPLQPVLPQLGNAKPDDLSQLSTRINSLQNSVGQLLALQTQHHLTSLQQGLAPSQGAGLGITQGTGDIPSNQIGAMNPGLQNILGHGLPPNRPDLRPSPRVPNPPMRTWSTGTLELPVRNSDIMRQDGPSRDKRRSLANTMRRDSSGLLDSPSDQWQNSRDMGPVATKWEHLPLAPELLRSLNRFGVGPPNKIQQRALPFLLKGSDIIAQAPPTQERIAAYVIPAIHVALIHNNSKPTLRGPVVVLISTTVDQATQSQRIIRDLGGSIGVRSALGVGSTSPNSDLSQELRLLQQNMPHILCGTPQKLHALFTAPGGVSGAEVRLLVLDEVDQLIARNLHEYVYNVVKLLPPPKTRGSNASMASPATLTPSTVNFAESNQGMSPLTATNGRRFPAGGTSASAADQSPSPISGTQAVERQTALFSNTVPQDVLNLANTIQLRDPVRVLVRRDGVVSHFESNQGTKGVRQYYLYLAFTASGARTDMNATNSGGGHGIIGSGRNAAASSETQQAREWKLDALLDLLDDLDTSQIIVNVGGLAALDAVAFKLATKGLEVIPLHNDMNATARMSSLSRFRGSPGTLNGRQQMRVLLVYDIQLKAPDIPQVPLVINYDLPQAVEEYAHRVAPAISNNHAKAGVVVNFVTAAGGDVEMLRSIECFYKIKCPEVPSSLRDLL